jgi:hypothetical protein
MHPIEAVLARDGEFTCPIRRAKYTSLYEHFHAALRREIFTWYCLLLTYPVLYELLELHDTNLPYSPPEFITRRLALLFLHQHNVSSSPSHHLHIAHPTSTDESFLSALSQLTTSTEISTAIDASVRVAAEKFVFSNEEQQAKAESALLAAEKLQLGVHYVQQAQMEVLERDLESAEDEGLFEVMARHGKGMDAGVQAMIAKLVERVMSVVGEVQVPEESEGDALVEIEGVEDDSEGSSASWSSDPRKEFLKQQLRRWPRRAGLWVYLPDVEGHLEERAEKIVQFLDCSITMHADNSTEGEFLRLLMGCRNIVNQHKGKDVNDKESKGSAAKKRGIPSAGGTLEDWREREWRDGRDIHPRVYEKALEVIAFIENKFENNPRFKAETQTTLEGSDAGSASGSTARSAESREGWYLPRLMPRPVLKWLKDPEDKEWHEYRAEQAVQFLDRCIEMAGQLTEVELWDVLDECRKIVSQSKGEAVIDKESKRPEAKKRGIHYRTGLGDAVVSTLDEYRERQLREGRVICPRVCEKALAFIELVETTMKPDTYTRPEWSLKDEWRNYYEQTIPSTQYFNERLRQYANNVEENQWKFDPRVVEGLEDLIEQGKGKVDAAAEEIEDESLGLRNSYAWGMHGKIAVLIRGYIKLLRDEGKQPDEEALRLAQVIVERANKQYEKQTEPSILEGGCGCCELGLRESLDAPEPVDPRERVIPCSFCLLDEDDSTADGAGFSDQADTVTEGASRLSPIHEDPVAEAEAASECESKVSHREGHSIILTEDGVERCENHRLE